MASKPSIPQGTRDFGPASVQRRKYIMQTIEQAFRKYGFMPLETPAMEQLQTLTGKYGDEGDQLLFKILNSGDYFKKLREYQEKASSHEELDSTFFPSVDGSVAMLDSKRSLSFIAEKGLRYDLTVPFARYVVMNRNEITLPFKRYQMQPVWRADRPQKGRYREFWQCDADVIGTKSLLNEAELLKIYDETFEALKIPVIIKVNNRKLLSALSEKTGDAGLFISITTAIDKLDKIGLDGVLEELKEKGLSQNQLTIVSDFLSMAQSENPLESLKNWANGNETALEGIKELETVFDFLRILDPVNPVKLDVTLARGLTYYTGAIVEVQANAGSFKSSIGGGGRYDNLTGIFGLPDISGVGISFGLDRIYDVMEELDVFPPGVKQNDTQILFCHFDEESRKYALKLCAGLRKINIAAEVYPDLVKKIGKQFEYADKLKIRFACAIGSDEMASGNFKLKNLETGEQTSHTQNTLIEYLKQP